MKNRLKRELDKQLRELSQQPSTPTTVHHKASALAKIESAARSVYGWGSDAKPKPGAGAAAGGHTLINLSVHNGPPPVIQALHRELPAISIENDEEPDAPEGPAP